MKEHGQHLRLDDEAEKRLLAGASACNWRQRTCELFRDIVILMRDTGMRNQRELYRVRIENRVVRIFDALNSKSYEPGLGKGLSAAAGKRFVNWAEFVGTESHRGSPALAWG